MLRLDINPQLKPHLLQFHTIPHLANSKGYHSFGEFWSRAPGSGKMWPPLRQDHLWYRPEEAAVSLPLSCFCLWHLVTWGLPFTTSPHCSHARTHTDGFSWHQHKSAHESINSADVLACANAHRHILHTFLNNLKSTYFLLKLPLLVRRLGMLSKWIVFKCYSLFYGWLSVCQSIFL